MLHYRLHRDPRSSHQQIARLLSELRPRLALDVGAAQGFLGRLLRDSGLAIDAVEPNAQWAEHARPAYRQLFVAPIEQVELPERAYDAVVLADVLEHLVDPAAILRRLRGAAAPNAAFIVSLPNVAHIAVRMMLLAGRFPMMDRGPLDRTHLHHYTRDTAADLLHQAGLRIERVLATGAPLEELWRRGEGKALFRPLMRFQHLLIDMAPRLFGYQWIFLARSE